MNENIKLVANNIKELVEGPFFIEQYGKILDESEIIDSIDDSDDSELISRCEACAAGLFNKILIICQLEYDVEKAKKLIEEHLGSGNLTSMDLEYDISKKLSEMDDYYKENTKAKMIDRLKHGFSVHFTTSQIAKVMKQDGEFKPFGGVFTPGERKMITEAITKQFNNIPEDKDDKYYRYKRCLNIGFDVSQGISMSAQTNGFWMYHTPEALTFLYGSNVVTRNKEDAMKHIEDCTDTLAPDERENIRKMLEQTWDRLIGEEERQAAVLIPRDALEYETVTYWNEKPPRVEEIRPFRYNLFDNIGVEEENRYMKPISADKLFFAKVPTVRALMRSLDFEELKQQRESRLAVLKDSAKAKEDTLGCLEISEAELAEMLNDINIDDQEKKGGAININE